MTTTSSLRRPARVMRPFRRAEDGSATVEFALLLPIFVGFFLFSFELGMLLTRQMMLDRAVDLTVRDVRLGRFNELPPNAVHDALVDRICTFNTVMHNCSSDLRLWTERLDPRDYRAPESEISCVDRNDPNTPLIALPLGEPGQLMYLRACALFDPIMPLLGLGERIDRVSGDAYALLSASAYVVEPN